MLPPLHRPFLLLQARDADDPMLDHERICFRDTMGLRDADLFSVNARERLPTRAELARASAVLVGGSGDYSVLDAHDWIRDLVTFTRDELVLSGKPTFASCFGFQILVLAIGGTMIRDPDNMEMGTYGVALTAAAADDPLFSELPAAFDTQVGHKDRAASLPAGVHVFAGSQLCPMHAFRVGALPIWATQFHPELDHRTLRARYLRYRALYEPTAHAADPEASEDAFLRGLRPSEEASALLELFARWVAHHEEELARRGL